MKKKNLVSVNSLEKCIPAVAETELMLPHTEIPFSVRYALPLKDAAELVVSVVESCVDKENGSVFLVGKDFSVRCEVLTRYANLKLPENLEKRYEIVYCSGVYELIMDNIDLVQYHDLLKAIDEQLRFEEDLITSTNAAKVNDLLEKVAAVMDNMESAMSGVDAETLNKAISSLASGKLDEKNVVEAILDAEKQNPSAFGAPIFTSSSDSVEVEK